MARQSIDQKLTSLNSLRNRTDLEEITRELTFAIDDKAPGVVLKAAQYAAELRLHILAPNIAAACDRLMERGARADANDSTKIALVKILQDLGHTDPMVLLKGMEYRSQSVRQSEQRSSRFRSACAIALAQCDIDEIVALEKISELFGDPDKYCRLTAVRAVAEIGSRLAALLIRTKAACGDLDTGVTCQCLSALAEISPSDHLPFVARYAFSEIESIAQFTIFLLSDYSEPAAVDYLIECFQSQIGEDLKLEVLNAIGNSRHPQKSIGFLFDLIEHGSECQATSAISALGSGRLRERVRGQLETLLEVRHLEHLVPVFRNSFYN